MADYVNNVAVGDKYTDVCTVGPNYEAKSVVLTIANNAVLMQFAVGKYGNWRWTDEREFYSIPQSFRVGNVIGVKVRNATPGQTARMLAVLGGDDDPDFQSGLPFSGTLSANGQVVTPGAGLSGDIIWSAAAARPGGVLCNGAHYDGTAATYAGLYAAIGLTYGGTGAADFAVPDLRDRVTVGAGGNTALAANDGVAAASRRGTKHRHSPHFHVVGQSGNDPQAAGAQVSMMTTANGGTGGNAPKDGGSGVATDPLDGPAFIGLNPFILL